MKEDIDIIEDFLDRSSYLMHTTTKEDVRELQVYMSKNDYRAIENLIARYKELEEKINKLKKEKEYYKKLYNESYNFLDPKFTGDHIPRID